MVMRVSSFMGHRWTNAWTNESGLGVGVMSMIYAPAMANG
jgi:hypothetical protein